MVHTFTNLISHVIFSTKDRRPTIDDELRPRLYAYLGGIVRELRGQALIINGTKDHVHMLISLPPSLSLSDAMRLVKTNSSRWAHEEWPSKRDFAWQAGYAAFSVSQSKVDAISS